MELKAGDFVRGGPLDRWADRAGHRVNMPGSGAEAARAFAVHRTQDNAKRRLRRSAAPSKSVDTAGKRKARKRQAGKGKAGKTMTGKATT